MSDLRRTCDSRVYEYLLPTYCLLPPASEDPLAKHLDESSPGWREGLGEAAEFADAWVPEPEDETVKTEEAPATEPVTEGEGGGEAGAGETKVKVAPRKAGEFERRRGWRCDPATLARFKALIKEFVGTQYVLFSYLLFCSYGTVRERFKRWLTGIATSTITLSVNHSTTDQSSDS